MAVDGCHVNETLRRELKEIFPHVPDEVVRERLKEHHNNRELCVSSLSHIMASDNSSSACSRGARTHHYQHTSVTPSNSRDPSHGVMVVSHPQVLQAGVSTPAASTTNQHSVHLDLVPTIPSTVGGPHVTSMSHFVSQASPIETPSLASPHYGGHSRKFTPPHMYDNLASSMSPPYDVHGVHSAMHRPVYTVHGHDNPPVSFHGQIWQSPARTASDRSPQTPGPNGVSRPRYMDVTTPGGLSQSPGRAVSGTSSGHMVYSGSGSPSQPHTGWTRPAPDPYSAASTYPVDNVYTSQVFVRMTGGDLVTPPPDKYYSPPIPHHFKPQNSPEQTSPHLTSGGYMVHEAPFDQFPQQSQWIKRPDVPYYNSDKERALVGDGVGGGVNPPRAETPDSGPASRSGSQSTEEARYTQALVMFQQERMDKLLHDLQTSRQQLSVLRSEVTELEAQVLKERRNRNATFPSSEDMQRVKSENRKLSVHVQMMAHQIDLYGQSKLGVLENESNFYKNLPCGQRGSLYGSHELRSGGGGSSAAYGALTSSPNSTVVTSPSGAASPRSSTRRTPPPRPPPPNNPPNSTFQHNPPPPPVASFPPDEGSGWSCRACTFANHPALNKCEVCEMPRVIEDKCNLPDSVCRQQVAVETGFHFCYKWCFDPGH